MHEVDIIILLQEEWALIIAQIVAHIYKRQNAKIIEKKIQLNISAIDTYIDYSDANSKIVNSFTMK